MLILSRLSSSKKIQNGGTEEKIGGKSINLMKRNMVNNEAS
jgi:hypothetical protein